MGFKTRASRVNLPKRIDRLNELSYNLWWTWDHESIDLFYRMQPELWAIRPDGTGDLAGNVVWKAAQGMPAKPSVLLVEDLLLAMASRQPKRYRLRPEGVLMMTVVPTQSAMAARSWFEMPKSGQSELMPPSGSVTPW